jgi:hypothetical protein
MKKQTKTTPSVVLTSPAAVVSGFTLGLDLGDRSHHVRVPLAGKMRVPQGHFENSPAFQRRESDRIANESRRDGRHSGYPAMIFCRPSGT